MRNVYDIYMEKKLMFVLADEGKQEAVSESILEKTAVFINLYYDDSWERYSNYIKNIPEQIAVYICSSNSVLLYKATDRKNVTWMNKSS